MKSPKTTGVILDRLSTGLAVAIAVEQIVGADRREVICWKLKAICGGSIWPFDRFGHRYLELIKLAVGGVRLRALSEVDPKG
jgi:hypothetical protein